MTTPTTETHMIDLRCQPGAHIFVDMARCQCGEIRITPVLWQSATVRITPTLLLHGNDDARMLHEIANALLVHQVEPFTPHRYPDFLRALAERLSKRASPEPSDVR